MIYHVNAPNFDYETITAYSLDVFITDGASMGTVETYDVNILEVNEPPVIRNLPLTITVSESTTELSELFQVGFKIQIIT